MTEGPKSPRPLDYASPRRPEPPVSHPRDSIAAALCIIGAGIISLSGAILLASGKQDFVGLGIITQFVAGAVLFLGLQRWFQS